eukprot:5550887-Alexandrium_andersonii.AAC.1
MNALESAERCLKACYSALKQFSVPGIGCPAQSERHFDSATEWLQQLRYPLSFLCGDAYPPRTGGASSRCGWLLA